MKEFICADDYRPHIPDGSYIAQCIKHEKSWAYGTSLKLYLKFRITEGEYMGTELFMPFNMPTDGKIKPGRKYYKTWVHVNGDRPPSRNTVMSPRLFKNKIFKIKTRTTIPKDNNKDMHENFKYSVVDRIEGVMAGL